MPAIYTLSVVGAGLVLLLLLVARWKMNPALALLLTALATGLGMGMPGLRVVEIVQQGFGNLLGHIGLMVFLGTLLGLLLEQSGAAARLAWLVRQGLPKRPLLATTIIGFLTGIPIFCDSGYVILSPMNPSLAAATGVSPQALALSLGGSVFTTHTLVPPTPGPIAAAGNVGIADQLGWVMLMGLICALPAALAGYGFAVRFNRTVSRVEAVPATPPTGLPSVFASVVPVLVPLGLIGLGLSTQLADLPPSVAQVLRFTGTPLIALLLGVACVLPLFRGIKRELAGPAVNKAIQLTGYILLVVGCGGAYGALLRETPLTQLIEDAMRSANASGSWFLVIAFAVAALFKSAQGSTTAAMAIGSAIVGPFAPLAGLTSGPELALLVAAIGAGAMTVSHVNDSYFWIVCQYGGLTPGQALRWHTVTTGVMGVTSLLTAILLFQLVH